MKKIISSVIIFFVLFANIFCQTKYEKVADKVYDFVSSEYKKDSKLSTGQKIGIGALVIGGMLLANELSKSKYEKIADKAYKVVKEMD